MDIRISPAGAARIGAVALAAVSLAAVAGCGHSVAGGTRGTAAHAAPASHAGARPRVNPGGPEKPAPAMSSMCAHLPILNKVIASETPRMMRGRTGPMRGKALLYTLTDKAEVQAMARKLCALPFMPPRLPCPADFGNTMTLTFSAPGHIYSPVEVGMTGCRGVTGMGRARWWSTDPGVWGSLNQVMHGHATR